MAKTARIKVTVVGYYTVTEDEVSNYDLEEFDAVTMAEVDSRMVAEGKVSAHEIIDMWLDEDAVVTLEPVINNPDKNCVTLPDGDCVSTERCMHSGQ